MLRLPKEAYEALKKRGGFAGVRVSVCETIERMNVSIGALSRETGISRPTLTPLRAGATKGIQFAHWKDCALSLRWVQER